MSEIAKAIRLQAAAVKSNQEKINQAEQLEAAAKILREQAKKPVQFDRSAIGRDRVARLEKFGAALGAIREEKVQAAVKAAGWIQAVKSPEGKITYGMKGKPGLQLHVFGNSFSVNYGPHVIQKEVKVTDPVAFLADLKAKI